MDQDRREVLGSLWFRDPWLVDRGYWLTEAPVRQPSSKDVIG